MEQLPEQQRSQSPQPAQPPTARVIHISVQPKTWFGKLIAGIAGVAIALVAFFVSIIAFAIIASIVVVAIIYFLWVTRRARRTLRNQTIEGEVQSRDIQ